MVRRFFGRACRLQYILCCSYNRKIAVYSAYCQSHVRHSEEEIHPKPGGCHSKRSRCSRRYQKPFSERIINYYHDCNLTESAVQPVSKALVETLLIRLRILTLDNKIPVHVHTCMDYNQDHTFLVLPRPEFILDDSSDDEALSPLSPDNRTTSTMA